MTTYLLAWILAAHPAGYPNAQLLIEPNDLMDHPAQFIVLDVRGRNLYDRSHHPGSVWVDVAAWSKAFNAKPDDSAEWSERLGSVGVDPSKSIVVIGDKVNESARLWWMLRYWGCPDVRLVNGGWSAYAVLNPKLSTEITKRPPLVLKLTLQRDRLTNKEQIIQCLKDTPPQFVDARSTGEYCGTAETAKRNGSIPGALHLEWTDALDPVSKRFKSPAELQKLIKDHQIDLNKPTVTYCQSGGRAAAMAFTLELMGCKQVSNYYKSWSEWGNEPDTPIAKPIKK